MKRIIVDTNAWIAAAENGLDLVDEIQKAIDEPHKIYVSKGILAELRRIVENQRLKYSHAAKLALTLISVKQIPAISEIGHVDDKLVQHSKDGDLVLTQDAALKKRLTKPFLTIRQKKKVIVVE